MMSMSEKKKFFKFLKMLELYTNLFLNVLTTMYKFTFVFVADRLRDEWKNKFFTILGVIKKNGFAGMRPIVL